jgi:hypothetical protein
MGAIFANGGDKQVKNLYWSYYLFINLDLYCPIFIEERTKKKFVEDNGFWDNRFELLNKNINAETEIKELKLKDEGIKELFIRLLKKEWDNIDDKYYYIKNTSDLAWVKANWDLFDESNCIFNFPLIEKMYIKIKQLNSLDNDKTYESECKLYSEIRKTSDLCKIQDYVVTMEEHKNK